jgi:hypothetical protein
MGILGAEWLRYDSDTDMEGTAAKHVQQDEKETVSVFFPRRTSVHLNYIFFIHSLLRSFACVLIVLSFLTPGAAH